MKKKSTLGKFCNLSEQILVKYVSHSIIIKKQKKQKIKHICWHTSNDPIFGTYLNFNLWTAIKKIKQKNTRTNQIMVSYVYHTLTSLSFKTLKTKRKKEQKKKKQAKIRADIILIKLTSNSYTSETHTEFFIISRQTCSEI